MTSDQIARKFYSSCKQSNSLANRRLRVLYDLHVINRSFPSVGQGDVYQHVFLDRAGAKILGLENYALLRELPSNYRHTILTTEFVLQAEKYFCNPLREYNLGGIRPDLYYPDWNFAVEIDTGSESKKTLKSKINKYRRHDVRVIFVTDGSINRVNYFVDHLPNPCAGCVFDELEDFLQKVFKKLMKKS